MTITYFLTLFVIGISLFIAFIWVFYLIALDLEEKKKIMHYPSVTLAVPAYNEESTISETIKSIFNLEYPKDKLFVIAINDGSKDKTGKILKQLKKKYKNLIVINKKKNEGKAKALNDALKITKTELFGCVDADSKLEKDSLKNLVQFFYKENRLDQNVAAVISLVKVKNPFGILGVSQQVEYLINALYRRLYAKTGFLIVTPGVLSVYQTKILKKIGGFDEKSITEDFEIAIRLVKNYYKVEMCPSSIAYTNVPLKLKSWWKQRIRWYRGFIDTFKKHRDLIFSKKHKALGVFFVPSNIFGPFTLFLSISLIIYKTFRELQRFIFKLIFAPETIKLFEPKTLTEIILETNYFLTIPIIILSLTFIFVLIKAIFFANESLNIKTLIGTIIYLYLYPYLTLAQWIHAAALEISKAKKRW